MRHQRMMRGCLALLACTAWTLTTAAPPGPLQLPDFGSLSNKAVQTVDITLDANLLGLATSFLDPAKPEDAAAKEVIRGLKGIYVRSYTFAADYAYPVSEVEFVRKQLTGPGWQKLVVVHDSQKHSNVDIYIGLDAGRASGLAIIASEPRAFTIVNIVGAIDLQKLHALEGKFGIPQMRLEGKN
jgi:Domain of unknown function (DUF4252)